MLGRRQWPVQRVVALRKKLGMAVQRPPVPVFDHLSTNRTFFVSKARISNSVFISKAIVFGNTTTVFANIDTVFVNIGTVFIKRIAVLTNKVIEFASRTIVFATSTTVFANKMTVFGNTMRVITSRRSVLAIATTVFAIKTREITGRMGGLQLRNRPAVLFVTPSARHICSKCSPK